MNAREPHQDVENLVVAAITERHSPTLGINAQDVLETVDRADRPAGKTEHLVAVAQAAAEGVGIGQDVVDHHVAGTIAGQSGAERGMVDHAAALQVAEEILDLVDRDGIAHADVDAPALLERAAAVDADQPPLGVEQRPAGIARIDRRVGLQAVGVFQQRAGRGLVAMHARDHAVAHRGLEIRGQQKRIADGKAPIAGLNFVAVGHFGVRKIVAAEQLDQGHVAGRIDAHDHGVVQLAIGHAALHGIAGLAGHVEVGQARSHRREITTPEPPPWPLLANTATA